MLLSYHKAAEVSSTLDGYPVENAFDENIHHFWSAKTGDKGEWLKVDLGKTCRIEAIQTNFMDQDALAFDMLKGDAYQYVIEFSNDGTTWSMGVDRSKNAVDSPHDYIQLPAAATARYVRLTNVHCPAGAKLSISGFRIFGNGLGSLPSPVSGLKASRAPSDGRQATVEWTPTKDADFYIVRYGIASERLFSNYQVYGAARMTLNALNRGVPYFISVDAVNENGITSGTQIVSLP
jgi:xylan 1,4-beta-xylosidase